MAAPIYLKIKERLIEEIKDKPVSTPIDSERELAVKFDASRMTVRKAVNELVSEGYLYRNKNRGTFIADYSLHKKNTAADSFIRQENADYSLIYFNVRPEPEYASLFSIAQDDLMICAVRLMLEDGRPATIEEIYYPYARVHTMEVKDLDEMLDLTACIEEGTVTQRFIPMLVPPEYSNLLKLEMNTPIIMVECTIRDMVGNLVAIAKMYHNPKEKIIEMTL
nr:GntR family transcriptional regulator [uncultured Sellimonas sp.]